MTQSGRPAREGTGETWTSIHGFRRRRDTTLYYHTGGHVSAAGPSRAGRGRRTECCAAFGADSIVLPVWVCHFHPSVLAIVLFPDPAVDPISGRQHKSSQDEKKRARNLNAPRKPGMKCSLRLLIRGGIRRHSSKDHSIYRSRQQDPQTEPKAEPRYELHFVRSNPRRAEPTAHRMIINGSGSRYNPNATACLPRSFPTYSNPHVFLPLLMLSDILVLSVLAGPDRLTIPGLRIILQLRELIR